MRVVAEEVVETNGPGRDAAGSGLLLASCLLSRLALSDTNVYEPSIRALLGSALHLCEVVLKSTESGRR